MRIVLWLGIATLTSTALAEPPDGWKLVWSDEFEKKGLPDSTKWSYEKGFIRNREAQLYTVERRENCRVEDGRLIIEARKEEYRGASYTSASIITKGKASWTYGRFEVRAKVPTGRGTWPAAWMLGTSFGDIDWPLCGEIDIMEFVGYEPDATHSAIHCAKYNYPKGTPKHGKLPGVNPSENFHVYAMEWHPDRIDFFFDGKKHFTFPREDDPEAWPFDKPHYLLLNLAIGGNWGGLEGIDDSLFPHRYEVDYVRVYEKE